LPHKSTPEEARAKRNEYGKKWRRKLRHDVLSNYSKKISNSDITCCNCCGENEFLIFLTIDHITNRKSTTRCNGLVGIPLYTCLRVNGYPPGYQILCCNCNSAKGDSGMCPHKRSGG